MIKVYKDILEFLKIENLFITGEKNSFCNLIEIDSEKWIVAIDTDILDTQAILNIKINNKYLELPIKIEKKGKSIYSLILKECRKKAFVDLQNRIQELEENHTQWEKRKEERYNVSENNTENFLLTSSTQTLIQNKIQLPCYLNNVSFSGANITTIMTGKTEYHLGSEVYLILKFSNPIEQLSLKAYIQSIAVRTAKNNTRFKFAILSLQLVEPPLSYKTRLGNYIKLAGE